MPLASLARLFLTQQAPTLISKNEAGWPAIELGTQHQPLTGEQGVQQ